MIYADNNGSLPPLQAVRQYVTERMHSSLWGNPNAIHSLGNQLMSGIERSRGIVAESFGAYAENVFFNSGSSEAVSTIFHSLIQKNSHKKLIITSGIEHSAVLQTATYYQNHGYEVRFVPLKENGVVDTEVLAKWLKADAQQVALVSIMAANNETGILQPYEDIALLCQGHKVDFFSDTTQLIGKHPFNFEKSHLQWAVISGHKLGALPGSGALLCKQPVELNALIHGGTQEYNKRAGTQNYLAIETMAIAAEFTRDHIHELAKLKVAREDFERRLLLECPQVQVIGLHSPRLAGTSLIGHAGLHGQAVQIELESSDIFVTTSAACSDNEPATSKVLKAMNINDRLGRSVVRISLAPPQGESEYTYIYSGLIKAYNKFNKMIAG